MIQLLNHKIKNTDTTFHVAIPGNIKAQFPIFKLIFFFNLPLYPRGEFNNSSPFCVEFKNEGTIPLLSLHAFVAWIGTAFPLIYHSFLITGYSIF